MTSPVLGIGTAQFGMAYGVADHDMRPSAPEVQDIVSEALAHGRDPNPVEWSTEAHTAKRTVAGGVYTQGSTVSRVGSTTYVDEGDARLDAA